MKLKKKVRDLNEVPEAARSLYEKDGDAYVLKASIEDEGGDSADAARIREFRDNNIALRKELDTLKAQFSGVDLSLYQKAVQQLDQVKEEEERKLLKEGKFDEVVARRTAVMRDEHAKAVKAMEAAKEAAAQEAKKAKAALARHVLNAEVRQAAGKVGRLRPGAEEDIVLKAGTVFTVDDGGKPVANAGGELRYGKSGKELTLEEWAAGLTTTNPYFFEDAKGGGASNDAGAKGSGGPGGKILRNPTPEELGAHAKDIAAGKVTIVRE